MKYNDYTTARNYSWKCLYECGVSKLPVSLSQICRHYGFTILKNSMIPHSSVARLSDKQRSKCLIADRTFIIIQDSESMPAQRYSIAHEIGHIILGHVPSASITNAQEDIAERFAIDLLAPACILWQLNLHTSEEIAQICNISITAARIRAERMEKLYERNRFLTNSLERQVCMQFDDFIQAYFKQQ